MGVDDDVNGPHGTADIGADGAGAGAGAGCAGQGPRVGAADGIIAGPLVAVRAAKSYQ